MDGTELLEKLREIARGMGIADVGVADANLWETDGLVSETVREGSRPRDILPDAESVVCIAIPLQKTIVDTTPSIYYNHLYTLTNTYLDLAIERLVLELGILGYHAVYVPRDGYHGMKGLEKGQNSFFSHRHAAYLAGMGTIGYNNMLITEKYGPRVRITSLITSAKLPSGKPMDKQLCIGCRRCTKMCPVSAVPADNYPVLVKKDRCVEYHAKLNEEGIMPCGKCIAVCPVGNDRMPESDDKATERIRSFKLVHNMAD